MDKHIEQQQRVVQLVFGPDAQLGGSMWTTKVPGFVEIIAGDQVLGRGPDFATAFRSAQRRAATLARAPETEVG